MNKLINVLYAILIGWLWCGAMLVICIQADVEISSDTQALTVAIVCAGALASTSERKEE